MTDPTRWPETRGTRGVVASPHRLAPDAGLAILRAGGNALDAAVAAATAIAVVYPHMNAIGGDSFWLVHDAGRRALLALSAAGRSAASVRLDDYRARFGAAIPARGGPAALTVPGAVSGWWEAHRYSAELQSTYHEFGAGIVAGDTGVLLQNRGAFFSLDPSHANRLAPRKRTAHTLIPGMYLVDGRSRLVYGTMGGEGQPQTHVALVTRIVDRGLTPQAAVEAPRWLYGRTWGDASRALRLESRFEPGVAESLRRRGHEVHVVDAWSDVMGHAQLIAIDADGLRGASDPRADGAALAW